MKKIMLFESFKNIDDLYQKSLSDEYWVDLSKKFPNYNNPNDKDCNKAVDYIYNNMKEKYPNEDWNKISNEIKDKIHSGIT